MCTCARVPVCTCQIILVLVYVSRISSAPKIRICRYVCTRATSPPQKKEQKAQHRLRERHTHNATVIAQQGACNNYGQRYRGCTCCLMDTESLMIRRPFGSIDPNSIRETELHSECRRRRERESLYSPQHDRDRDAAPQRAAATRLRETNEARAERLRADRQRNEAPAGDNTSKRGEVCVSIRPGLCLCLCVSVLLALVACKKVWLQKSFRSIVIVVFAL